MLHILCFKGLCFKTALFLQNYLLPTFHILVNEKKIYQLYILTKLVHQYLTNDHKLGVSNTMILQANGFMAMSSTLTQ
jgi:hypothetical protein